jgi:hypothetical protein
VLAPSRGRDPLTFKGALDGIERLSFYREHAEHASHYSHLFLVDHIAIMGLVVFEPIVRSTAC